jgi:hypothetical protein
VRPRCASSSNGSRSRSSIEPVDDRLITREDAEDFLMAFFVKELAKGVFRGYDPARGPGPPSAAFTAYVLTRLRRFVIDDGRSRSRILAREHTQLEDAPEPAIDPDDERPDLSLEAAERRAQVIERADFTWNAIRGTLSPRQGAYSPTACCASKASPRSPRTWGLRECRAG